MWDLAGGPQAWNAQREEARLVEIETSNPHSQAWRMREVWVKCSHKKLGGKEPELKCEFNSLQNYVVNGDLLSHWKIQDW